MADYAWREGGRIRHADGRGYNDFVPDESIRTHLERGIRDGDPDCASFAAATLALRNLERLAQVARPRAAISDAARTTPRPDLGEGARRGMRPSSRASHISRNVPPNPGGREINMHGLCTILTAVAGWWLA